MTWVTSSMSRPRAATSVAQRALILPCLNLPRAFLAVVLAFVAVNLVGGDAGLVELLGDLLNPVLRFGKDEYALQLGAASSGR